MKNKIVVFGICVLTLLYILIILPTNTSAETGTDTIHEDYYKAHPISFQSGEYITISYTMQVTDGPHIDVYFVDSDNYVYYKDGKQFDYYATMSDENTIYASNSITLHEHDTYYLIFDNTDVGTDPPWNMVDDIAYVSWTINSQVYYPSSSDDGGDGGDGDRHFIPSFELPLLIMAICMLLLISRYNLMRRIK